MTSFCRTTGGKGLHVVVPLEPVAHWDAVKPFCRAFAETLSQEQPERFLSTVKKADRRGRILIDWLRNGLGATAVASFSPRARPVRPSRRRCRGMRSIGKLDPAKFTLRDVPERLARLRADPWQAFSASRRRLPDAASNQTEPPRAVPRTHKSAIITAKKPKRRA